MNTFHPPGLTSSRPILPIVLAGGGNLDHWPRSRVNMPIQFQRQDNGYSSFERALMGL